VLTRGVRKTESAVLTRGVRKTESPRADAWGGVWRVVVCPLQGRMRTPLPRQAGWVPYSQDRQGCVPRFQDRQDACSTNVPPGRIMEKGMEGNS